MIDPARLAVFADKTIGAGAHAPNEVGCAMELASFLAGEPWSDQPACVSPVIAAFMRGWNDGLPSDAERDRLLRDLIPLTLGTVTTPADDETRAWMALDWLVRVHTPAWLRLAGLGEHADILGELAAIADEGTCSAAKPQIDAAGAVAWAAAGDAAGGAARAAAGAVAWDATRAAAGDAVWPAAWAAAWAAGRAAGRAALAPTVADLQQSARDLVIRMCEVGR